MSINYFDADELKRWFQDNGDNTHRLNYNLNEDSLVFDLGGYDGAWSDKIYDKYRCYIFVFEPVSKHYNILLERFKNINHKIKIFNFGLSNDNIATDIYFDNDSSSIYTKSINKESILLKNINEFLNTNNIHNVDLLKINIEGAEFDLLDHIIASNKQNMFKNIQVQFHKIFDGAEIRRDIIRENLSRTHKLTYNYNFVWENWEILK